MSPTPETERVQAATESFSRGSAGSPRPTLDSWLRPPSNRWALRHTRELFASERVSAPVGSASPGVPGRLVLPDSDEDYLRRSCTDALVVLQMGRVVAEWYADGVRAD